VCVCVCVRASVASEINEAANKLVFFGFSLFINRLIPPPPWFYSSVQFVVVSTPTSKSTRDGSVVMEFTTIINQSGQ
jgi:hypothetical protein